MMSCYINHNGRKCVIFLVVFIIFVCLLRFYVSFEVVSIMEILFYGTVVIADAK